MRYIIFILIIFTNIRVKAQTVDNIVADKLLHYEFVMWSSTADSIKFNALMAKAALYNGAELYNNALKELDRAGEYTSSGISKTELDYEKVKTYFLANRYSFASGILISVNDLDSINKKHEYVTMLLYSLNEEEKWKSCKSTMLDNCNDCDSATIKVIRELSEQYRYISPERCKKQSGFLPGLGQTMAGYPLKGATSFLLQAGLTTFLAYNIYTGFYVAGAVSGLMPLLKFHKGGKRLSAILAEKRNEKNSALLKHKYAQAIKLVVK